MAKAMVTRTVTGTMLHVLTVDTVTHVTAEENFYVKGVVKDADKALRKLRTEEDTDTLKLVAVLSMDSFNKLYGMTEEDFMKYAEELPDVQAKREEYAANKAAKNVD